MTSIANSGKLRVIGGFHRSRIIRFQQSEGLRPTSDRMRETLFNWLQTKLFNTNCLDCFAGSGILGIEALSRGAQHCTFLDNQRLAASNIEQNCVSLNYNKSQFRVWTKNAMTYLKTPDLSYDLVFLDPPYHSDLLDRSLTMIIENQQQSETKLLASHGLIYIEHSANEIFNTDDYPIQIYKRKKMASSVAYLIKLVD